MKVTHPERLYRERLRKGYSQTDLGALVGVTQQYISLLESGKDRDCSGELAMRISQRLDIDLEYAFEHPPTHAMPHVPSPKPVSKRRIAA